MFHATVGAKQITSKCVIANIVMDFQNKLFRARVGDNTSFRVRGDRFDLDLFTEATSLWCIVRLYACIRCNERMFEMRIFMLAKTSVSNAQCQQCKELSVHC